MIGLDGVAGQAHAAVSRTGTHGGWPAERATHRPETGSRWQCAKGMMCNWTSYVRARAYSPADQLDLVGICV